MTRGCEYNFIPVRCPQCGEKFAVGKIGCYKYFCSECCVEFTLKKHRYSRIMIVLSDGVAEKIENIDPSFSYEEVNKKMRG